MSTWPGARLTETYNATIQRYRKPHIKFKVTKMHILGCISSILCVKFENTRQISNLYTAKYAFYEVSKFYDLCLLKVMPSKVLVRRAPGRSTPPVYMNYTFQATEVGCMIWSWSPMVCEKYAPRDSVEKKMRTKAEVFVVSEAQWPSFSHGMGEHDQILL